MLSPSLSQDQLYREQLLDHYHNPQGWGLQAGEYPHAHKVNPTCGDEITVQVILKSNVVTAMHFEGHSCVISRAAASLLSEHVAGKTSADVLAMNLIDMQTLLGITVPPARISCTLLALEATQRALQGNSK
jgi:nitrogen fixation NifU-like protein